MEGHLEPGNGTKNVGTLFECRFSMIPEDGASTETKHVKAHSTSICLFEGRESKTWIPSSILYMQSFIHSIKIVFIQKKVTKISVVFFSKSLSL